MSTFTSSSSLPPTFIPSAISSLISAPTTDLLPLTTPPTSQKTLDDDDNCAICLLPLSEEPFTKNHNCTHHLHTTCSTLLLSTSDKCPYCRALWLSTSTIHANVHLIRSLLLELETLGTMHSRLPRGEEAGVENQNLASALRTSITIAAHCMQIQDIRRRAESSSWQGRTALSAALHEESEMKAVANSSSGYQIIAALLRNLQVIDSAGVLRLASSNRSYSSHAAEYEKDLISMMSSSRLAADFVASRIEAEASSFPSSSSNTDDKEPNNLWTLSLLLILSTIIHLPPVLQTRISHRELRFLVKVVVWSLVSCMEDREEEEEEEGKPSAAAAVRVDDENDHVNNIRQQENFSSFGQSRRPSWNGGGFLSGLLDSRYGQERRWEGEQEEEGEEDRNEGWAWAVILGFEILGFGVPVAFGRGWLCFA